jgi:acyl dehydratase
MSAPGLLGSYAKAVAGAVPVPVLGRRPSELRTEPRTLEHVEIDTAHLAAYDRVCGFRLSDELPPTYLHVLAFPLALAIMTERSFPFGVLGLVHIENRIEQLRPVRAGEPIALRVAAENLRDHEKGRAVDLVAEATVDGELVWRDVSTYLRRGGGSGSASGDGKRRRRTRAEPHPATARWKVPGDIGRRYADVSGDRNPIHLHPLTAKAFGMPGAIAHGMWVKARCLAALEGVLPERHTSEVQFKAPMRLPAKVEFSDWREKDGAIGMEVRDARSGRPHLTGRVTVG